MGLFGSILLSWEVGQSLSQGSNHGLLWHWAIPHWGKGNMDKVKPFLISFPMSPILHYFFLQWCARTSPTGLLDFSKSLLKSGGLSKTIFSRGSWTSAKRKWTDSWATLQSAAQSTVCMPSTRCTGGWDSSQILWCLMLALTASRVTFVYELKPNCWEVGI